MYMPTLPSLGESSFLSLLTHPTAPSSTGNYVKMVHNGIEYGDMQLIAEAYDVLKVVGGFTNEELAETFDKWNKVGGGDTGRGAMGRVGGSTWKLVESQEVQLDGLPDPCLLGVPRLAVSPTGFSLVAHCTTC